MFAASTVFKKAYVILWITQEMDFFFFFFCHEWSPTFCLEMVPLARNDIPSRAQRSRQAQSLSVYSHLPIFQWSFAFSLPLSFVDTHVLITTVIKHTP